MVDNQDQLKNVSREQDPREQDPRKQHRLFKMGLRGVWAVFNTNPVLLIFYTVGTASVGVDIPPPERNSHIFKNY